MRIKIPSSYIQNNFLSEGRGSHFSGEEWKNHLENQSNDDIVLRKISEDKSAYKALLKLIPDNYCCENGFPFQDLFFDSLALNREYADLGIKWQFKVRQRSSIVYRRGSSDILKNNDPFTILSLIQDNRVIQNIIYNHLGKCVVSVDFETHGVSGPAHWHCFKEAGLPIRSEGDGHSYPYYTCPWIWLAIPYEYDSQQLTPQQIPENEEYVSISFEFKGKKFKINDLFNKDSDDDEDNAGTDEEDDSEKNGKKKLASKSKKHGKEKRQNQKVDFKQAALCLDSAVGGGAGMSMYNQGVGLGNTMFLVIAFALFLLLLTRKINFQTIQNILPKESHRTSKKELDEKKMPTSLATFKPRSISRDSSDNSNSNSSSSSTTSSSSYMTKTL